MTQTFDFTTTNLVNVIVNPTSDKTILIKTCMMKLSNNLNHNADLVIKYGNGQHIGLSSNVNDDGLVINSEVNTFYNNCDGGNINMTASALDGNLKVIVEYELI